MKILETIEGWTVEHNGTSPIAIEGENFFPTREEITAAVAKRNMHVWSDGSIEREPEPLTVDDAVVDQQTGEITGTVPEPLATEIAEKTITDVSIEEPPAKPKRASRKKATSKPKAQPEATEEKPKRGRPRLYSEEEAEQRRREKARVADRNRTPEQKKAAAERAKRWRENNPEKVKKARERSVQRRSERYAQDPDFRRQVNDYQVSYKRGKRGAETS